VAKRSWPDHRAERGGKVIVPRTQQVEDFFAAYGKRSNDALQDPPREDVDGLVASFAPFLVGAGPKGVFGAPNGEDFRKMIPQGFARYREVGGKAMTVTRVKVTELDDFNAMARVDWDFAYERPKDGRKGHITFQNLYFLNFATGEPKVFAYITPDEERAMKDHGLI
jgi:hypothetical protein